MHVFSDQDEHAYLDPGPCPRRARGVQLPPMPRRATGVEHATGIGDCATFPRCRAGWGLCPLRAVARLPPTHPGGAAISPAPARTAKRAASQVYSRVLMLLH